MTRRRAAAALGLGGLLLVAGCAAGRRVGLTPGPGPLACPASPNCVSSDVDPTDGPHLIAPFPLRATPGEALMCLRALLAASPRTVVGDVEADTLHAEATSRWFGFVDDLDFVVDADAQRIRVRSMSRFGYSDMGVNRERLDALRARYDRACDGAMGAR